MEPQRAYLPGRASVSYHPAHRVRLGLLPALAHAFALHHNDVAGLKIGEITAISATVVPSQPGPLPFWSYDNGIVNFNMSGEARTSIVGLVFLLFFTVRIQRVKLPPCRASSASSTQPLRL